MKLSLKVKKKILSLAAAILVVGNLVHFATTRINPPQVSFASAVYAEASYESTMTFPANQDFSYESVKNSVVNQRAEELAYSKENIRKIESYLRGRGAPLAAHAATFEKMAVKYNLPYNLMPAISIIESGGGKYNYRPYNYAGMGGQGNAMVFSSFDAAIEKHAQILRYSFFDKGADTPYEIGRTYCFQCPTWGSKVQGIMNQIDAQ